MNIREKDFSNKLLAAPFFIILTFVAIVWVVAQMFGTRDTMRIGMPQEYHGTWYQVLPDGEKHKISIPVDLDIPRGEVLTIETVLPQDVTDNTCMTIRSSHQSIRVFVDGELRLDYDTTQSIGAGNNSASRYLFVYLSSEDSGKLLQIESVSDSIYSGVISPVYYGDEFSSWIYILNTYIGNLIIAFVLFVAGIVILGISLTVRLARHRNVEMDYLGWATVLVSLWMISESKLRQLIFHDSATIANLAFLLLLLASYAVVLMMDRIQKLRYHRIYVILGHTEATYVIFICILHHLRIADVLQTMLPTYLVCMVVIVTTIVNIIKDIREGFIVEYKYVAIGIGVLIGGSSVELLFSILGFRNVTGVSLGLGYIVFIVLCGYHALMQYRKEEIERERTIASVEMKDQFLANMSHELRTPLNSVLGMNSLILKECNDPQIIDYARDIDSSGNMLLNLVNDILDFSKLGSGKFELTMAEYHPLHAFREIQLMLNQKAEVKDLKLVFDISSDIPKTVLGDEVRVEQILINIINNGIKYTRQGGVTVKARSEIVSDEICNLIVEVIDTGMGIRTEDIDKLFDSFTRVDTYRNRGIEGTGLGLAITKGLIEQMGGDIHVSSIVEQGSTFEVIIPQKIIEAESGGEYHNPIEELKNKDGVTHVQEIKTQSNHFTAPGKKVLVVDDNGINRKVIANMLKTSEMEVDQATGGRESIEMCHQKEYDIILMDHMMPDLDGIEALHQLKAFWENRGTECKTVVIALTANAIAGMREMYLAEGFNDYLSKPLKAEVLEATLDKYLSAKIDK